MLIMIMFFNHINVASVFSDVPFRDCHIGSIVCFNKNEHDERKLSPIHKKKSKSEPLIGTRSDSYGSRRL